MSKMIHSWCAHFLYQSFTRLEKGPPWGQDYGIFSGGKGAMTMVNSRWPLLEILRVEGEPDNIIPVPVEHPKSEKSEF